MVLWKCKECGHLNDPVLALCPACDGAYIPKDIAKFTRYEIDVMRGRAPDLQFDSKDQHALICFLLRRVTELEKAKADEEVSHD